MELPVQLAARAVLAAALSACGDNRPWCRHDDRFAEPYRICEPAQTFAARDSTTLVPTQEAVELYADRWQRTIEAEPLLYGRGPQRYLNGMVWTRNPKVIAAWTQGIVKTGDADFDAISSELRIEEIHWFWREVSEGLFYFRPYIQVLFNEDIWIQRLAETYSAPWDPDNPGQQPWPFPEGPHDNGYWTWLDGSKGTNELATAQIDFTFGWGDCVVACDGFHKVRAIVPADGPTIVYDMGGDPLPPWLHLSPNTMPSP
jgi:hypothetical protein